MITEELETLNQNQTYIEKSRTMKSIVKNYEFRHIEGNIIFYNNENKLARILVNNKNRVNKLNKIGI